MKEKKEKEKAELAIRGEGSGESPREMSSRQPPKKSSAYANVFSSDSDQESSSNDESMKSGLRDRKLTLAMQKEDRSRRLQELADRRKELKSKKEIVYSTSDEERGDSQTHSKQNSRRGVYSSSSSGSESSISPDRRPDQKRRRYELKYHPFPYLTIYSLFAACPVILGPHLRILVVLVTMIGVVVGPLKSNISLSLINSRKFVFHAIN